jgi:hypothetical protein
MKNLMRLPLKFSLHYNSKKIASIKYNQQKYINKHDTYSVNHMLDDHKLFTLLLFYASVFYNVASQT